MNNLTKAASEDVPVLIAGAGPVGLLLSILLSRQGIKHVVVEKRSTIGVLPRARGITVRSVEILSQLGLAEGLAEGSLRPPWTTQFVYTETLAGELLGSMPQSSADPEYAADYSPFYTLVAAQDRVDPLLYRSASAYPQAEIRFDTEVLEYAEDDRSIVTTVRKPNGTSARIRSRYLIAADGGKSLLRELAGIRGIGRTDMRSFINNHVRADLSRFTQGREGALIWTLKPGVEGVFQMLDGKDYWAIQVQYDPGKFGNDLWTEDQAVAHMRAMIGDQAANEVHFEILKAYTYTISTVVSEKLREGRLILTGDAAHQAPPYGGFGLNTGLQSAHNLSWKLGAILRGEAPPDLLDTYDQERREVAHRVCAFSRTNAGYVEQLMASVRSAASIEEKRSLIASSRQYGNFWGLDLGVHYEGQGAFIPDDVPAPPVEDAVIDYVPHAKPGWRAPHFWALYEGRRVSSIALFDGGFKLLAGPQGQAWVQAAREKRFGLKEGVTAYRVAHDGELAPEINFCALYGIDRSGAVLIRPDGHVAYRARSAVPDCAGTLRDTIDTVLRRSREVAS